MIITLCGSARFEPAYVYWNELLTYDGHTVFSLSVFPSQRNGDKDWYSPAQKDMLDHAHLRKIDASDAVFFITREFPFARNDIPYLGESSKRELIHAMKTSKRIFSDVLACPQTPCGSDYRLAAIGRCDQCQRNGSVKAAETGS